MKNNNWTAAAIPSQKGKVIIVTGANSGLGLEAADILCQKDATVIMAVRHLEKGRAAMDKIKSKYFNAKCELMQLDLSDIESIHSFSNEFHSKYSRLDILMNNAGVMLPPKREETKQGFEIQFGINHLGHFALTGLLLDLIIKTPGARVVTQSSIAHKMLIDIDFNDLNWEKKYNNMKAYSQSKLSNLLFTFELDRQFKAHHINAIAVAAHPGISSTNLFRSSGAIINIFGPLIGQKAEIGALPMLRAATEETLSGSEYFGPDKMMESRGYPVFVKPNKNSLNIKLADDLWQASEKLTGITFKFSLLQ
jgi:NAD(P)-dependent dehydrogenase (short-subunit alcohol dehydrogenase family)